MEITSQVPQHNVGDGDTREQMGVSPSSMNSTPSHVMESGCQNCVTGAIEAAFFPSSIAVPERKESSKLLRKESGGSSSNGVGDVNEDSTAPAGSASITTGGGGKSFGPLAIDTTFDQVTGNCNNFASRMGEIAGQMMNSQQNDGNNLSEEEKAAQCNQALAADCSPTSRGVSLIVMVSQLLKSSDEAVKESYKKGEVIEDAQGELRTIYEQERQLNMYSYNSDQENSETFSMPTSLQRESSLGSVSRALSWIRSPSMRSVKDHDSLSGIPQFKGFGRNHSVVLPPETDPFAVREGMTLAWKEVNLTIKGYRNREPRQVLKNVWGEVPKKETTAIMGGSGAGKTSLLNILAGRTRTGGNVEVSANIRLDNVLADPTSMAIRQMIAFVAQDDSLQVTATPREAIRFSAKLRLGRKMTDEQLDSLTDSMLEELGLSLCADTIVGGPLIKGISGGERKRTSVGVELVVKPAMVFLDEPTSGLDSFSAVQVCQLLKKVARAGASVMFTIHQPSSRIFREFDHLILLNKGRVMYQGPVSYVADYFGARGQPCPRNYNPADWVMKVAQKVPVEELERCGFFPEDERDPELAKAESKVTAIAKIVNRIPREERPPTMWTEISMLVQREMVHIRRNKAVTIARVLQTAILATLIGVIFYDVGTAPNSSITNIQSHFGALVMTSTIIMMGPAQAALLAFPDERPVFLREYSTKHYCVTSYFLSRLSVEAIMGSLQSLATIVITYNMIKFQGSFAVFYSTCFTLAMGSTAIAVVMGAASGSSAKLATAALPLVLLPQMLFVGFFVSPELIPAWLRWIQYICPMTYATRILLIDEFYNCSEDPMERLFCNMLLTNVNAEPDDVWWYWVILVAQFVAFRVMALVILYYSAQQFY